MTMTPKQRAKVMEEIFDSVIDLTRCYTLWWFFLNKPNTKRYAKVEMNYPDFFITVADSLRQSFCIITYRLFDKRRDVKSLIFLIDDLKYLEPSTARVVQQKIDAHSTLVEKVTTLRHNVFGHLNKKQSPQDVFKTVKLTPREMKTVVVLAQDIISTLAGVKAKADLNIKLNSCEAAVRCDAYSLMQALERYDE